MRMIPCSERTPKLEELDRDEILIFSKDSEKFKVVSAKEYFEPVPISLKDKSKGTFQWWCRLGVTHWRELPVLEV